MHLRLKYDFLVSLDLGYSPFDVGCVCLIYFQPGLWRYTVTNNGGDSIDLLISISAHASQEGVDPIVITSELSGSVTNVTANEPLVVFGEVRQGLNPIINATVIAILERPPDSDGNPSAPVELELLDNGAGKMRMHQ